MNNHEFELPDELGWDCNDEINKMFHEKMSSLDRMVVSYSRKAGKDNFISGLMEVWIAEVVDEMYAIIKKYQKKQGLLK